MTVPAGATPVLFVRVHRSGSTLFDLLMGEVDGFFAAGELTSLWTTRYCGCGRCHEWAQMPVVNVVIGGNVLHCP